MATKVERIDSYIVVTDLDTGKVNNYPASQFRYVQNTPEIFTFISLENGENTLQFRLIDLVDENENAWESAEAFSMWLRKNTGTFVPPEGGFEVAVQDQHTPPFDFYFSKALGAPTSTTVETIIDGYDITVTDATLFSVGTWTGVFSGISGDGRYYWAEVLSKNGNVLTMDSPFDCVFPIGSIVLPTTRNMNVDGSITPQIFSIQAGSSGLVLDITRLLLSIVTTDSIELGNFGDIPPLPRGIIFRKIDGIHQNYWNIKTNYELGLHSYDISVFEQVKPNDVNALLCRNSFAGPSKHGVTIRIEPGDELQMIIQDDLTDLLFFLGVVEGHEVT